MPDLNGVVDRDCGYEDEHLVQLGSVFGECAMDELEGFRWDMGT